MSRAVIAVAALILAGLSGCGTTANIHFPKPVEGEQIGMGSRPQLAVYGGVANDVRYAKTAAGYDGVAPKLLAVAAVLDIPFSAIADTLTLPITGSVTIWRIVDALNYMAEDHKRASIFHSEWWRFWCNGEPTPVAQLPES